jgi:hypothetical protein
MLDFEPVTNDMFSWMVSIGAAEELTPPSSTLRNPGLGLGPASPDSSRDNRAAITKCLRHSDDKISAAGGAVLLPANCCVLYRASAFH